MLEQGCPSRLWIFPRRKYPILNDPRNKQAHTLQACNTLVDLILTFLPAFVVWNLQLTQRIKLGLGILLSLSIFAAVASIVKTVKLKSIGAGGDITHNLVAFVIWFTVENNVVIAAASVPTIRPLFVRRSHTTSSNYRMHSYESPKRKGYALSGSGTGSNRFGKQDSAIMRETTIEMRTTPRNGSEVELTPFAV